MTKYPTVVVLISFMILSLFSCITPEPLPKKETHEKNSGLVSKEISIDEELDEPKLPKANREFRAAWVATVANINWPSKPGLSSSDQQREAVELLDLLKNNNFNAVIFQVRPQADALYKSELEPWSYYLTGEQGKAPEPYYDPLHFWIEAAHDRGLELHAWLNPYRAHHTTGGEISEQSVIKENPELVVELENGMWWMDPAKKRTKERTAAVVMDLVSRYDLDGIHFDDYFYPYSSYNGGKDFQDQLSWEKYQKSGGELSREDWRRENVNSFVETIYKSIKEKKPHVKFGISPFGIWRPGYPESIKGFDQYSELYADAKLWLNKGWIDYFTPQLYWKINQSAQSFPVLLGWWAKQNQKNRHLWPGIKVGLGGDEKNEDEVINQIMISRGLLPGSPGVVFWSIAPLLEYPNIASAVFEGPYNREALVPESPWLDKEPPRAPIAMAERRNQDLKISWVSENADDVFRYVIYYKYSRVWNYKILNRKDNFYNFNFYAEKKLEAVWITAIDRTGNESKFRKVYPSS